MTAAPRPVTPLGILAATLRELAGRSWRRSATAAGGGAGRRPGSLRRGAHDARVERAGGAGRPDPRAHPWAGALEQEMLSGHVEGQLLRFLVRMTRARRVLDDRHVHGLLGAGDGRGAARRRRASWHARSTRRSRASRSGASPLSPAGSGSTSASGPPRRRLRELDGRFDLVFIDADKAGYQGYVDTVLERGPTGPGRAHRRRQHPHAGPAVDG